MSGMPGTPEGGGIATASREATAVAVASPRLEIRDVRKTFEGKKPVEALGGVSMSLAANEFVSLVGTSGCGKSTLLSIVAGLADPTAGDVLVDGVSIDGPGRDRGVVFQTYTLFPWLTARENVAFALRGEKMSARERREVADEHLSLVGLESRTSRRSSSWTSRSVPSTRRRASSCRSCSRVCGSRTASPSSSSPMTSRRPCTSPTGSSS
jgi:ABC-type glutathione transport system ATPase component